MNQFTNKEVQRLQKLNDNLKVIEEKTLLLLQKENQIAFDKLQDKKNGIEDYEATISFDFFSGEKEIANYTQYVKSSIPDTRTNLNNKEDHNVLRSLSQYHQLHYQSHCWLLHVLYDDLLVSWDDIAKIDSVFYDIHVIYQYSYDIK